MTWFFIALIAPALWALSNHLDKFILTRYFKGASAGALMIFSVFLGSLLAILIPIFNDGVFSVPLISAITVTISGTLYLYAYLPYLHAMQEEEASIVAPLFQIIPLFSYVGAYFLLGESLNATQLFASVMIILGAMGISLEIGVGTVKLKMKVLGLMALSSLFFATNSLIFKFVAIQESFWVTTFWEYVGFSLAAAALLVVKSYRQQFFKIFKLNGLPILSLNALTEFINISSKLIFSFASLLAPITLVWVVNGFQPFFVFLLGIIITIFAPKLGEESLLKKHLVQRFVSIAIMFIGVYFLNK
ncbi:MAG: EamA family transporter [Candidatus Moranbacteria bacterium]|nr:EamA family transporter [Candidatus Moranbacteria bacterium]